jgi:hypothetical protein
VPQVSAALHVSFILFVPWHMRWVPAPALAVIASGDFCLILGILILVGKFTEKPKIAEQ